VTLKRTSVALGVKRSRRATRDADAARAAIETGHEALARVAWEDARRSFEDALSIQETPEALEGLGMAAWWLDDAPTVFDARERAYRLFRKCGNRRGAGRVAMTVAEDYLHFRGETAVAKGWHARAHRLLDGLEPVPEHGWLRVWEGDLVLAVGGEPSRARDLAAEAAEMGRTLGDIDLEMTALALEGLALVLKGALSDGMPLLDEATTAAVSGEMSNPVAIGLSCCYLVMTCEWISDFERAAQWCARVKELATRTRFNALLGLCRAQYAGVLVWRGAWAEAEAELEAAVQQLGASRPAMQSEGLRRLADLRRMQGRFDEARALLGGLGGHPQAILVRAALALDTGDVRAAAHLSERFLRGAPSSSRTDRVHALDVLHRARLALDQRKESAPVLEELRRIASMIGTAPIQACGLVAEGLARAADGEHGRARGAFEDAIDLYARAGARYEQACVRVELGKVLLALAQHGPAESELDEARRCFQELGAAWRSEQAAALLKERENAPAASTRSPPAGGLTRREIEVLKLVAGGLSNRRIARNLSVSEFTVKRHVANILLKLGLPSRAAAAAYAGKTGLV
jgi:ATP/maltotriose-dependent transcriptional regulator MalT